MTRFAFGTSCLMDGLIPRYAFLTALLAASVAPAASAAEKAPARAPQAAAPKSPILTPAQLQECENLKTRLRTQNDDALRDRAALDAEKAELARSGTTLAEELTTLDRTSDSAVEAYNAKAGERDRLIDSYQSRVAAFNLRAESVNEIKDRYEKSCVNRRYDERDLNDLKRKK